MIKKNDGKKTQRRKSKSVKLSQKEIDILQSRKRDILKIINQMTDFGAFFRAAFQDTCFSWKKTLNERISVEDTQSLLTGLIASIREEEVCDEDLERLLKRCEKFMPSLFTYLQHEGIPLNNILAERNLRKFAKRRRDSQDFKNKEDTKYFIEYLSLYI